VCVCVRAVKKSKMSSATNCFLIRMHLLCKLSLLAPAMPLHARPLSLPMRKLCTPCLLFSVLHITVCAETLSLYPILLLSLSFVPNLHRPLHYQAHTRGEGNSVSVRVMFIRVRVCVCVRVMCVSACVRVCTCVCVRACLFWCVCVRV